FLDIDKDDGIVGTEVEIIGEGFMENEDITVEYDDDDVTDDIDGADKTDGDGEFDFTFEIPESTVGDHTITVTDETGNKAEVTFTVEENLELSPDSGPPGTVIIVNGTGFGYREDFDRVRFNNVNILGDIDEDRTDRDGSFTFTYTIPATLGSGTYTLSVRDDDGNEADATFTIAVISNIDKTTGSVGETLTITGTGFTTGTAITVTYGGNPVTLSVSNIDTNGNLTAQFSAPASAAGPHNIVLIVGTHIKTFVFTMEAVPPDAPNLLLPLTGEKAKQPITFDWSDVTDDSGVTYILWVSNDTDFATLVLEKTGLTDSAYTMTEAEELASVGKDAPYYWSVRAVDNASNLGAWAASSTFTVGFSFDWPTWAWWVVGGVGGLIIILVFFWFGRRSITY
ncbi:MAG TPA: IPT/TIG domain-containing protein, partial [Dehalococcoidales bacterium]|nr:IPT/TIG domain-containing protein [Dehalococcoidales bacterium]